MKALLSLLLSFGFGISLLAQDPAGTMAPKRSPEELEKLLAPIALYPDSLIALILPASTVPSDIVLGARYVAASGDMSQVESQPWDDGVKALTRYPSVLNWMDRNLEWTRDLGEAFVAQPADVMDTVQRLRGQARASGILTDNPQQRVVEEDGGICIVPSQAEVIYVPAYDPDIFWRQGPFYDSYVSFGVGFVVGSWLNYDCDWHRRRVWVHQRNAGWAYRPDWKRRDYREHGHDQGHDWVPDSRHANPPRHYGQRPPATALVNTGGTRQSSGNPWDGRGENRNGEHTPSGNWPVTPTRPDDHGHHPVRPADMTPAGSPTNQNPANYNNGRAPTGERHEPVTRNVMPNSSTEIPANRSTVQVAKPVAVPRLHLEGRPNVTDDRKAWQGSRSEPARPPEVASARPGVVAPIVHADTPPRPQSEVRHAAPPPPPPAASAKPAPAPARNGGDNDRRSDKPNTNWR